MQKIIINRSRKYRSFIYCCLVFIVSCIVGFYFYKNRLVYLAIVLIGLSIFYQFKQDKFVIEAITLPSEADGFLELTINGKQSDFWIIKKRIIISGWIYLHAVKQGSRDKIRTWLHKSNFASQNNIKDLAKYLLLSN